MILGEVTNVLSAHVGRILGMKTLQQDGKDIAITFSGDRTIKVHHHEKSYKS